MLDALSTDASALRAPVIAGKSRRFAIISTVAFAAIVAVAVYSFFAIYRELTESALSRRSSLSYLTAATLSEKFERVVDVGVSLATRVRFRELIEAGEWSEAARILRAAPADFEFIERIGLIDPQGALLAGVPEVPAPGQQNFADRDWFQAAARGGKPHISQIFKRAAPPQLNVFVAAVPIRSSKGALLGVLVVQMTVARFFDWIRTIDVGPDRLIYVVDRRGTLAFHPTLPLQGELVDFSRVPVVRQVMQGSRGVETTFNPVENEERVSAYAPVPAYGWGVVVAEPSAAVFETRNRLLGLALVAYILILAFFAAFVVNRIALQRERTEDERRVIAERERRAEEGRRRAQDALARQSERLRILREIHRSTIAEETPQSIAESAILPLRELLDVPRAIVNMFDLETGEVEWLAAAGRRRLRAGPGVRYSIRLMGDVGALRRGEPQIVDTQSLPPGPEVDALLASGVRVYMVVPMIAGGELIGAISFGGEQASFSPEQTNIAQEIATQLAIAITQARLLERVKRHADELEQRVRERTAQLEAANKELEAFSYSVSHDLRAPLRAVDGFSRIVQEDYAGKLDAEGLRLLGVIRDNSRKMGQLIDDLLEYSRLGRKPLSSAEIDMKRLVEDALGELHAPGGRSPRLDVGALPPARGDATLLKQVWTNLLANAVKFSSTRGQPVIEVSGHENGAQCVYCVKDNGAGFDMRYHEKLFNVFQRLHREEEFEGTGVGLAIVQRVVSRHGGRVWAEGKVDGGAAFYFSLPKGESDGSIREG